jgi:hypothetical protein
VSREPKPPRTTRIVLRLSDEAARRLTDRLGAAKVRLANALDGLLATADAIGKARTRVEVRALQLEYQAEREAIHRRFMDEMRDEKAGDAWPTFVDELRAELAACLPEGERPRFGSWFDHLAHCLCPLEQQHWAKADIAYWRKVDSTLRERHRKLTLAINDLQAWLNEPSTPAEMRRLPAAIAELTALKAAIASFPWGDMFGRRKHFGPATLTARIIGGLTLDTLRGADLSAGREPRDRLEDADIDFIMARLDRCLGGDDLPDRKDIEKTLRGLSSR